MWDVEVLKFAMSHDIKDTKKDSKQRKAETIWATDSHHEFLFLYENKIKGILFSFSILKSIFFCKLKQVSKEIHKINSVTLLWICDEKQDGLLK